MPTNHSTPSSAGEANFPTTGKMIQRFTAANMTHFSGSLYEAEQLARAYDVIASTPGEFKQYMSAMRSANPNLIMLGYINGTFAQSGQAYTYPATWYLHSSSGQKVRSRGYGNYAMDPANGGWVNNRVQTCAQVVSQGYDGCMLDMLGSAPTQPGYLDALPINPATHRDYTADEWLKAASNLGAAVAHAVYPRLVTGNGLGSGPRYFDPAAPSSTLFNGLRGAIGEAWLKSPGSSSGRYPNAWEWKENVDALVNAGQRGDSAVALTKTWGGGTQADINAWHLFSLASFLLGTNGTAYYEFSSSNTPSGIMYSSPWESIDVGTPTGSYTQVGNIFQRSFTKGLALVNPSGNWSRVTLSHSMCDENGTPMSSVSLGPDGAAIFYNC